MQKSLDWDDLRLVLSVFREGTLSGAARVLGLTHSTVFRRLGVVEEQMGVRLFERFRGGYVPTPAGETAAASAACLEHQVLTLERKLSGQDLRPSGIVRVATTDTLAVILMRHLAAMRAQHPQIRIEIVISNAMANLTRREADIAIRPTSEPSELLVGRRAADIAHAIYGSHAYLSRHGERGLSDHDWIGLDDALARTVIGRWMRDNIPAELIACRVDAFPALRDTAEAGLGLAMLPCYVGDLAPGLRRVTPKTPSPPRSALWLLTHDDLKRHHGLPGGGARVGARSSGRKARQSIAQASSMVTGIRSRAARRSATRACFDLLTAARAIPLAPCAGVSARCTPR
jgi:DNA-binding transcriptional LysR family regulator